MSHTGVPGLIAGKGRAESNLVLGLLEDLHVLPSSYFKKLVGTDLWECRVTLGSDAYRVLCFFAGNSVVVLTHGFAKKTQKTPRAEIERAETYRRDFLRRKREK